MRDFMKKHRRVKAHLSTIELTQIHLRSPYVAAWWSAAFPGFGHMLLSKNIPGLLLFAWEVIINMEAKINLAMVYSFSGRFQKATDVLDTSYIPMYIAVYLFSIWDSYRIAVDTNKLYLLADHENASANIFKMGTAEINYLDKREPWVAMVWSLLMPGTGHLYVHKEI